MTIQPANLLILPTEVLLVILGELYEIHHFPTRRYLPNWRTKPTTFRSIDGLRSISVVNRRLRLLCTPLLFKITLCTSLERLVQLNAECTAYSQFAELIKQLDVAEIDTLDVLHELLPRLTSLVRLDLEAYQVNPRLLTILNSHPTLATVAVHNLQANTLINLLSSTDLSFSKLLVSTTTVNRWELPPHSEAFRPAVQRGARFHHIILAEYEISNFHIPVFPQLEHFDVDIGFHALSVQSWLPDFVQRHPHLRTIRFGDNRYLWSDSWSRRPDITFAHQLSDALHKEDMGRVKLSSFSIARPASWTSLGDWEVVQLELDFGSAELVSATDFAVVMEATTMLAPRLLSLDLILLNTTRPVHIDDFAKAFRSPQCLRTLHLRNAYRYLHVNEQTPWMPSKRERRIIRDTRGTSICVTALDALRWYIGRVAQEAPALELVHVTDGGQDGRGRFSKPWALEATYRVRANAARDLETVGTPKLVIDPKYLPRK